MIEYKCVSCRAKLETDDSLSGKQEACPACGKTNPVPLSARDRAEQKRRRKEAVQRQKAAVRQQMEAATERRTQLLAVRQQEEAAPERQRLLTEAVRQQQPQAADEAVRQAAGLSGTSRACQNPNCAYRGQMVLSKGGGSMLVALLLWLLLLPAGILYTIFCFSATGWYCPHCGMKQR